MTASEPGRGAFYDEVVELRIHGVSGTPPESMLDDPRPRRVAGDESGRIFRRTDPVVAELHGGDRRIVEAFHWGRFTAGSASRALWLLLLPFALVNLARYALLMPADLRRKQDKAADLVLRLLGLVLTLTIVITVAYIALDLGARQCGSSPACVDRNTWFGWFVDRSFGVRVLVASLAPGAVIALIWWFGRQSFSSEPPGPKRERRTENGSLADLMFWRGAASAPVQRAAHVMAACALLGALALGILGSPRAWLAAHRGADEVVYFGLFGLCAAVGLYALLLVVRNQRPSLDNAVPDRMGWDAIRLPPLVKLVRILVAAPAAAVCVLWVAWQLDNREPDRSQAVTGLEIAANIAAAITALMLIALLLICAGTAFLSATAQELRGRTPGAPVPRAFKPFWFGLGAWMVAALAATFAWGFSTAVVFWTAKALGSPVLDDTAVTASGGRVLIELPASYWTGALLWGVLTAVMAVMLLPLAAWLLRRRITLVVLLVAGAVAAAGVGVLTYDGSDLVSDQAEWLILAGVLAGAALALLFVAARKDGIPAAADGDYDRPGGENLGRARGKVARAWRTALARYRYHHALGTVAVIGGVLVIAAGGFAAWRVLDPRQRAEPPALLREAATGWFGTLGVTVVTAIAAGLVVLGISTWRKPSLRTTTGILWDLVSFWPRLAHPLCPPPYGGRAVLGVAVRAAQLTHAFDARRVVLSGHSQGGVIAVAACAVLGEQADNDDDLPHREDGSGLDPATARETLDRLALATYGSQLQFIYARLFPSYLGFQRLRQLYTDVMGGQWRNAYRWTDPLGGPVLSWPGSRSPVTYGPCVTQWTGMSCGAAQCEGHPAEEARLTGPDGLEYVSWRIGPDVRLRDPDVIVENAMQPRSPMRGHSGYYSDPVFDALIADLADPPRGGPPACPPAAPGHPKEAAAPGIHADAMKERGLRSS